MKKENAKEEREKEREVLMLFGITAIENQAVTPKKQTGKFVGMKGSLEDENLHVPFF